MVIIIPMAGCEPDRYTSQSSSTICLRHMHIFILSCPIQFNWTVSLIFFLLPMTNKRQWNKNKYDFFFIQSLYFAYYQFQWTKCPRWFCLLLEEQRSTHTLSGKIMWFCIWFHTSFCIFIWIKLVHRATFQIIPTCQQNLTGTSKIIHPKEKWEQHSSNK